MRLFFGMVLGCLLTVGAAFVHDSSLGTRGATPETTVERPMVNWDVVRDNFRRWGAAVQEQWNKLTGSS